MRKAREDMLGKQRFSGRENAEGKGLDTAAPRVDSIEYRMSKEGRGRK